MLGAKLVTETPALALTGLGGFKEVAESLSLCIERRKAVELFPSPSSLLSEGRRPLGTTSVDILFEDSLGRADGQRVLRWISFPFDDPLDSKLGLLGKRLVLLSVRARSELVL